MTTYGLPDELADIAGDNDLKVFYLVFAEAYIEAADLTEKLRVTGEVLRTLAGTFGQQQVAWEDLHVAVEQWHMWDLSADAQGHTDDLSMPSRERVAEDVDFALNQIVELARRLKAVS